MSLLYNDQPEEDKRKEKTAQKRPVELLQVPRHCDQC